MNEHNHQKLLLAWFEDRYPGLVLFAIPNGGHRDPVTAARLKAEGVRPGVPDLFLAAPRGPVPGLFIEMKASLGGRLSAAQRAVHALLRGQGYTVSVPYGYEAAKTAITSYLEQ